LENEKIFRTKTGYCHVLPDKIVLTRNGVIGDISKVVAGNTVLRFIILYGLVALWLLYSAVENFLNDQRFFSLIWLLLATFLIQGIFKSWNNSAAPIIERHSIRHAAFHPARKGLTRAYFEIHFEDQNGKFKKRLIMLPGSLSNGEIETQKAVEIMTSEKILTID